MFQYHKFSEFFFIEQDVELKRDLEISGVSLNVYNLWVSKGLAMSPGVGDSWETLAYFYLCASPFL